MLQVEEYNEVLEGSVIPSNKPFFANNLIKVFDYEYIRRIDAIQYCKRRRVENYIARSVSRTADGLSRYFRFRRSDLKNYDISIVDFLNMLESSLISLFSILLSNIKCELIMNTMAVLNRDCDFTEDEKYAITQALKRFGGLC